MLHSLKNYFYNNVLNVCLSVVCFYLIFDPSVFYLKFLFIVMVYIYTNYCNYELQTSGALPESVTVMKYFEANYDHGCAGMDEIKCLLKETKSRIIACQAGQSYLHHVRQYQVNSMLSSLFYEVLLLANQEK